MLKRDRITTKKKSHVKKNKITNWKTQRLFFVWYGLSMRCFYMRRKLTNFACPITRRTLTNYMLAPNKIVLFHLFFGDPLGTRRTQKIHLFGHFTLHRTGFMRQNQTNALYFFFGDVCTNRLTQKWVWTWRGLDTFQGQHYHENKKKKAWKKINRNLKTEWIICVLEGQFDLFTHLFHITWKILAVWLWMSIEFETQAPLCLQKKEQKDN